MNKYRKQASAHEGHNGTFNGIKGKKAARIVKMNERGPNNRTPQEQLAYLDARGFVAARERARLEKKVRPLGKLSGDIKEFEKSLNSPTVRVLA